METLIDTTALETALRHMVEYKADAEASNNEDDAKDLAYAGILKGQEVLRILRRGTADTSEIEAKVEKTILQLRGI